MKVYISGPITNVDNFEEAFFKREKTLKSLGYLVANPVTFCKPLEERIRKNFADVCQFILNHIEIKFEDLKESLFVSKTTHPSRLHTPLRFVECLLHKHCAVPPSLTREGFGCEQFFYVTNDK